MATKSSYNPEFLKEIKHVQKQKGIVVDTNDLQGNLKNK